MSPEVLSVKICTNNSKLCADGRVDAIYNQKPFRYPVNNDGDEVMSSAVNTHKEMWCRHSKSQQVGNMNPKGACEVLLMVGKDRESLHRYSFPGRCLDVWLFCSKSQTILLQPVDVVAQFKRRSQLQSQILHHHLAFQQEQSVSVYLLEHIAKKST